MEKTKVLIELKGGLIQNIIANREDIEIVIADYDSEDWDDSKTDVEIIKGSAWMRTESQPDTVSEKIYEVLEKRENKNSQEKYVLDKLKELNF
jgi:hypothetical protein